MTKLKKSKIEFYITNVCNYNCDNCNRLNNYYFSGHDVWKDYEHVYQKWSSLIDFEEITILGGEPLLNPSLDQWIIGIRNFWPNATINLLTNGSRLNYWYKRGLFDLLSLTNTKLQICLHNRSRRDSFLLEIKSYLKDPEISTVADLSKWVLSYNTVKDESWPNCYSYEDFKNLPEWIQTECIEVHNIGLDSWCVATGDTYIRDKNNIDICVTYYEDFVTAPLKYTGNNRFSVYNSDPVQAHHVCISKHCTHFIKGKMYKCHHVALLPEFMKQFDVNISDSDQRLLLDYQPLTVEHKLQYMDHFLKNLENPIPQCKLCPSSLENVYLQSSTNKPKIKKIIPIKESKL